MLSNALFALAALAAAPATVAAPCSMTAPAQSSMTAPAAGTAQDPQPNTNPDKRPEVEALANKLEKHIKKEGKEDTEAVAVIDQIHQEFPKCGPKDRVLLAKVLGKCFEQRRLVPEGEPPNNKLYIGAAVSLGDMGPESAEVLMNWIGAKNLRKDLAVQRYLILSLGKTKDKRGLKPLKNLLDDKENALISASAEALGEYAGADLETRKDVFEAMLKALMDAKNAKDADSNNNIAKDKFDIISAPLITSLAKVSKHEERDPQAIQAWWNKHKRDDWDKLE